VISTLIHTTAKSAKAKLALTLLGVVAVLGGGALVYAAKAKPTFTLSASPSARTAEQGKATTFSVKIKRLHKFKGAVNLTVSGLPSGATASWKLSDGRTLPRGRRGASVLAKTKTSAVLTVQTAAGTPAGSFKPVIKGTSGRLTRTKKLRLSVVAAAPGNSGNPGTGNTGGTGNGNPGNPQTPPGEAERTLTVIASPASRNLLQGDETSYSVDVTRSGFDDPVALSVTGLPAGVTAAWTPGESITGTSATVTLTASSAAAPGTYDLTITGTGGGVSGGGAIGLVVQETRDFGIAGDVPAALRPGSSATLDLTITNPYGFDLKVEALNVTVSTDKAGCDGATNYEVDVPAALVGLTLPPGTTSLSSLVPSSDLPTIEMLNLATNQNACKSATLDLDYTGIARK